MSCWLGIDAGTSGIKAIIVDETGKVLSEGYSEEDITVPGPGFAEQAPEIWWQACGAAVKQAVGNCGAGMQVSAIGFSGQMQGTVFLDKNFQPVRNCMIWMDQRAVEEVGEIERRIEEAGTEDRKSVV